MAEWYTILLKVVGVVGGYIAVSYPPFQTTDFSAMNINHALIRLESVLSNPQPDQSSAACEVGLRSACKHNPISAFPIVGHNTLSISNLAPVPFALRFSNAVVLMAFSTPVIHCL
jgi:hypothetical protein